MIVKVKPRLSLKYAELAVGDLFVLKNRDSSTIDAVWRKGNDDAYSILDGQAGGFSLDSKQVEVVRVRITGIEVEETI